MLRIHIMMKGVMAMAENHSDLSLNAFCQSARLEGMGKSREHRLETYIRKLIKDNGIEFVIARFKVLKQDTIDTLADPSHRFVNVDGEQSISWLYGSGKPKGPLGLIYDQWKRPENRLRAIGALIQAFELDDPSPKQLKKFLDGVSASPLDIERNKGVNVPYQDVLTMARGLRTAYVNAREFSGQDMTGMSYFQEPGSSVNLGQTRKDLTKLLRKEEPTSEDVTHMHQLVSEIDMATENQFFTAPPLARDFVVNHFGAYQKPKPFNGKRPKGTLVRDYDERRISLSKDNPYLDPNAYYMPCLYGDGYYDSSIGMLQKPGGKLRTVYNVNRFVNYSLGPFAKAVENLYDSHKSNIFVLRQDKAFDKAQQWIRSGKEVSSKDLTSASDLLDIHLLCSGLRQEICDILVLNHKAEWTPDNDGSQSADHEIMQRFLSKEELSILRDVNRNLVLGRYSLHKPALSVQAYSVGEFPMLHITDVLQGISDANTEVQDGVSVGDLIDLFDSVTYFEVRNMSPSWSSNLDSAITPGRGSKLGIKGSFQMMTYQNYLAGYYASLNSGLDPRDSFAVVGDDFVCDNRISSSYDKLISMMGGKSNGEKAMTSDRYAEICSHVITRDRIFAIKPRYRVGKGSMWLNLGKTSIGRIKHVYRVTPEDENLMAVLAASGDPSESGMGIPTSSFRLPEYIRNYTKAITQAKAYLNVTSGPDDYQVSRESLDLAHLESIHGVTNQDTSRALNRDIYTIDADGHKVPQTVNRAVNLEKGTIKLTTTRYNHHNGKQEEVVSQQDAADSIKQVAKDAVSSLGELGPSSDDLSAKSDGSSRAEQFLDKLLEAYEYQLTHDGKLNDHLSRDVIAIAGMIGFDMADQQLRPRDEDVSNDIYTNRVDRERLTGKHIDEVLSDPSTLTFGANVKTSNEDRPLSKREESSIEKSSLSDLHHSSVSKPSEKSAAKPTNQVHKVKISKDYHGKKHDRHKSVGKDTHTARHQSDRSESEAKHSHPIIQRRRVSIMDRVRRERLKRESQSKDQSVTPNEEEKVQSTSQVERLTSAETDVPLRKDGTPMTYDKRGNPQGLWDDNHSRWESWSERNARIADEHREGKRRLLSGESWKDISSSHQGPDSHSRESEGPDVGD